MKHVTSYNAIKPIDSSESLETRFENLTLKFYRNYTRYLVINKMYQDSVTIEWKCFDCKAPVHINIEQLLKYGRFNQSQLFCSKHKPEDNKILRNHLFMRYESAFFKSLKAEIIDKTFNI
jgi:hypothetical protein